MRRIARIAGVIAVGLCAIAPAAAADYYVSLTGGHNPPFTTWSDAATNIQDAIDLAAEGDTVWVTNGIYATGGKDMVGDLTNRVALDKALTVQSVNGPAVTVIQGATDPVTTFGSLAVRCAWLTNGAVLRGFTLRGGATGTAGVSRDGGGIWAASTNCLIENCHITNNLAANNGGGVFAGTVVASLLSNNLAQNRGGGARNSTLIQCEVTGNRSYLSGGGISGGWANNCRIRENQGSNGGGGIDSILVNCAVFKNSGGGAQGGSLTNCTVTGNIGGGIASAYAANCIIQNNVNGDRTSNNVSSSTLRYCCTTPAQAGIGNLSVNAQLLADGIHLADSSPCIGAGEPGSAAGTDIDGQAWEAPPSMGCVEWQPEPYVVFISVEPGISGGSLRVNGSASGQSPLSFQWLKEGIPVSDGPQFAGTQTPVLGLNDLSPADQGGYQLVASNAWGFATSAVYQLVVHFVDAASVTPISPYTNWATAAQQIQQAVDVAPAGSVVLVTNGVYDAGGKPSTGQLTNRVSVDKALVVMSVNGKQETIIQGRWDPVSTNGPGAVRCVWLASGAILDGFTLRAGATLISGSSTEDQRGGGVFGVYSENLVSDCEVTENSAYASGGGAYRVTMERCGLVRNQILVEFFGTATDEGSGGGATYCTLRNCLVIGNRSLWGHGGGAYSCSAWSSLISSNSAGQNGGGAYKGVFYNCTFTGNKAVGVQYAGGSNVSGQGGGVHGARVTNSIVYGNLAFNLTFGGSTPNATSNHVSSTFAFSCTEPLPAGPGNIAVPPQLLADNIHVAETSPCRGAGTDAVMLGTDINGQSWSTPPSMGCDEWHPEPATVLPPTFGLNYLSKTMTISLVAGGASPMGFRWSKDGTEIVDGQKYGGAGTAFLVVSNFNAGDKGSYQAVVTNNFGAVTSSIAQLVIRFVNVSNSTPISPFTNWATAANTIQAAVDVADPGNVILVTNGVYVTGGRATAGVLTNRVTLDKAVALVSVNGPEMTTIQGQWDPVTTNGPLAIRGVWMSENSLLGGFTVRGSATLNVFASSLTLNGSGGGVACESISSRIEGCRLVGNSASTGGGGIRRGTVVGSRLEGNLGGTGLASGGGAVESVLINCFVSGNQAARGGGASLGVLVNCTVVGNWVTTGLGGGGVFNTQATNSIIYYNFSSIGPFSSPANYVIAGTNPFPFVNCCTSPERAYPGDVGNIFEDPQLLDSYHLAVSSSSRGAGLDVASGNDLDGEPWAGPPSIGCDEVWEAGLGGDLTVGLAASYPYVAAGGVMPLAGSMTGRATRVEWDFAGGSLVTSLSLLNNSVVWTNAGSHNVSFTAFNTDHPNGVATNLAVQVVPLVSPSIYSVAKNGNSISFYFTGQPGLIYWVDRTIDLTPPVQWQTLRVFLGAGQPVQVSDFTTTNSRFYRLRIP